MDGAVQRCDERPGAAKYGAQLGERLSKGGRRREAAGALANTPQSHACAWGPLDWTPYMDPEDEMGSESTVSSLNKTFFCSLHPVLGSSLLSWVLLWEASLDDVRCSIDHWSLAQSCSSADAD